MNNLFVTPIDSKTNVDEPLTLDNTRVPIILAVDDQPITRELLAAMIKAHGLEVETAADGVQALSMWNTKRHPLIITDCRMPHMDGFALAKEIRHIEQAENLQPSAIIALTANVIQEEQVRCEEAGMDDFLTKPINMDQLKSILSSYVQVKTASGHGSPIISMSNEDCSPIDKTILDQVLPDSMTQTKVLKDLQHHIHHDFDQLQQLIHEDDLVNAEFTAHRMKGSCRMVGVIDIANVCAEIEKKAQLGSMAISDMALSTLGQSIREFDAYMHHQLSNSS